MHFMISCATARCMSMGTELPTAARHLTLAPCTQKRPECSLPEVQCSLSAIQLQSYATACKL